MATTRSQAARDAAAEITTERESSTSVASDAQIDNMMAFLQQIVSHQIEERRARENEKEEQEESSSCQKVNPEMFTSAWFFD